MDPPVESKPPFPRSPPLEVEVVEVRLDGRVDFIRLEAATLTARPGLELLHGLFVLAERLKKDRPSAQVPKLAEPLRLGASLAPRCFYRRGPRVESRPGPRRGRSNDARCGGASCGTR